MRSLPAERSVLGGFVVAMVVMLLLSSMARLSAGRHDEAVGKITNTYEEMIATREIIYNMLNAEEMQRDYFVEGEPDHLKMHQDALFAVDEALGKTERLVKTLETQDALGKIRGLIGQRRKIFRDTQAAYDSSGWEVARSHFDQGRAVTHQLLNAIDEMTAMEVSQLQMRIEEGTKQHEMELFCYGLLSLALPFFFILLFFRIRREIRLRGNAEMALAESHERKELAQDLHDDLAQILAIARIKLVQMLKEDGIARSMLPLQEVNELVTRANQSVRLLLAQITRTPADGVGLMPMFNWLIRELRLIHDIDIQLSNDSVSMLVDQQVDIVVYRTVRDLLLNAVRSGSKVNVAVERIGDDILITLGEGGAGSVFSALAQRLLDGDPGLDIIGERLRRIGGKMSVADHYNGEIAIMLRVPVHISSPQQIAA